jgi:hypothetical protein
VSHPDLLTGSGVFAVAAAGALESSITMGDGLAMLGGLAIIVGAALVILRAIGRVELIASNNGKGVDLLAARVSAIEADRATAGNRRVEDARRDARIDTTLEQVSKSVGRIETTLEGLPCRSGGACVGGTT